MDRQRIVITGVGVVAPNGIGKEEFWKNCRAGVSGIKPITLFDVSKYRCRYAGEISNFQPEIYLGSRGLRNLDRTTLLALVAAKLAIEDSGLSITDDNRNDIGVVLGSTMGSVHSISEFDMEGLREGPRYVNPAHFPNTVINSPASQVAIRFGLKGLNATIATGFCASLDAFGYAMNMLSLGRAQALLVGGVEELCIQTFLGFYKNGFLAVSADGSELIFSPFEERHRGTLLGEGAAFFILETLEAAKRRKAPLIAELLGYGCAYDPEMVFQGNGEPKGVLASIETALKDAAVFSTSISCVSASANGIASVDQVEEVAFKRVFQDRFADIEIGLPKKLLGELFSASSALQMAHVLGVRLDQLTACSQKAKDPALGGLTSKSGGPVLINSISLTGHASSLVMDPAVLN